MTGHAVRATALPVRDPVRVRVFVGTRGDHGNPLMIVHDAACLSDEEALAIAASSGTSETVFVDDETIGRVRIYVPTRRVPFAGHPLVGVAAHLATRGRTLTHLETDAGAVPIAVLGSRAAIVASAGLGVPWRLLHVSSVEEVQQADPGGANRHDYVWAWDDESAGRVRARAFTSASGTIEDEATGSAAVELCARLGRELIIHQGRGSELRARPLAGGRVELSGRVCSAA